MSDPKVKVAEARVAAAKARLTATAGEIQRRIKPDSLVREAVEGVREKSSEIAEDAVAVAKARPGTVASAVAGVAALTLRKPIGRLARRLFSRRNEKQDAEF
ncbi:MAG: hypothetical protein JOY99_03975 [Sphingomonadaceae bacterium]|nr:hypothetical protein [Sphingomonadaceae bacterium]